MKGRQLMRHSLKIIPTVYSGKVDGTTQESHLPIHNGFYPVFLQHNISNITFRPFRASQVSWMKLLYIEQLHVMILRGFAWPPLAISPRYYEPWMLSCCWLLSPSSVYTFVNGIFITHIQYAISFPQWHCSCSKNKKL